MKTLLPIFILVFAFSCKSRFEKTSPKIESISESVYASGVVKSKDQYQVYSTVNGLILDILVHEGDHVRKGDTLIRVRNEPSKLNTDNAKLAVDNADLYANADKTSEAKVTIDFARSKMKNDSLLLERQRNLWSKKIGSLNDFEQRQLAYKNSLTNYQLAILRYSELKRQLLFASRQSKTNLKINNALEGDYLIKSETNGVVYKILKEKGELVNTLNPVAIMGDANDFLIEMKVDEYDIARIREGQKVLISMDSYKGEVFEGKVEEIEPLMNEQSRSFTVKALFVTKPPKIYPNLSVETNIVIRTKVEAMTIPRTYLVGDTMVRTTKTRLKKVVVGLKDYQKAEIKSGLTVDDVIYKPNP